MTRPFPWLMSQCRLRKLARISAVNFAVAALAFGAFSPRTAGERAEALGDLSQLSPELQRLLTPDDDFNLIEFRSRATGSRRMWSRGKRSRSFERAEQIGRTRRGA
jgi:hypothetical protein